MLQLLPFVKRNYELISLFLAFALFLLRLWLIRKSKGPRRGHLIPAQNPGFFKIKDFGILDGDSTGLEINLLNQGEDSVVRARLTFALVSESIIEIKGISKTEFLIGYSEEFRRANPIGGGLHWNIRVPSVECRNKNMPEMLERYVIIQVCYKRENSLIPRAHKYLWTLGAEGIFEDPSAEIQAALRKLKIK